METITDIILAPATVLIDTLDAVADLLPKAALVIIPLSFAIAIGLGLLG